MADAGKTPILVWSSLFPNSVQPGAGNFVRERMFRVAAAGRPLSVVSPVPWFPGQALIQRVRPHYRPQPPLMETQQGIDVWHPRFLSAPALGRRWDGASMARAARPLVHRLVRERGIGLIDAHFAYPDGYAATRVGRRLGLPVTLTLRGTEVRHAADPQFGPRLRSALRDASHIITVSDSLRQLALANGAADDRITVVGNGVDSAKFRRLDRDQACAELGLGPGGRYLITVGGLTERKGFHRVIELLPRLLKRHPELHYLVVGGASAEGDWGPRLRAQVDELGLGERVHFLGSIAHAELYRVLSAADVFVLPTRNEGWANVFLEAMACGLPVVATDVGGNAEVVASDELGTIVPFGDSAALGEALDAALARDWDREALIAYAAANDWSQRVEQLEGIFRRLLGEG